MCSYTVKERGAVQQCVIVLYITGIKERGAVQQCVIVLNITGIKERRAAQRCVRSPWPRLRGHSADATEK